MGCWNGTCGLTQLHIKHGQDVVVFAMVKNNGKDSLCYTTPFYAPVQMPFYAKYNDYGGGEECSGFGLSLVMNAIKEKLVELPLGENEYHDIAVKKENFNDELFFEAVHEGRLFIQGAFPRQRRHVGFTMIHKGVWDNIIENRVIEQYVGDGNGTTGWGNNYIEYKFADVIADLPDCVDYIVKTLNDEGNPLRYYEPLRQLRNMDEKNLAAKWFQGSDNYRYSNLTHPSIDTIDYAKSGNVMDLTQYLTELLKFMWIDSFMLDTRKFWSPQAGAGSQNQEHEGYRLLIDSMTKVLDAEKAEYDAENED